MEPLAKQKCVQINRVYDSNSVRFEERSFFMYLYPNEIVAESNRYALQDVFDMTYYPHNKSFDAVGFLYLHTNRGVKTYYVKEKPLAFVQAYKRRTSALP